MPERLDVVCSQLLAKGFPLPGAVAGGNKIAAVKFVEQVRLDPSAKFRAMRKSLGWGEVPADLRRVDVITTLEADLWRVEWLLAEHGITGRCITLVGQPESTVEYVIEKCSPRVVLDRNEAFLPAAVERLSAKYPAVRFVTGYHDSQAYLMRWPEHLARQNAYARLAMSRKNVFYGTPDERNWLGRLLDCSRVAWLPNIVKLPAAPIARNHHTPFVVSIACRRDLVKNIPPMIHAVKFASRHAPLKLLLCIKLPHDDVADMARLLGLDVECQPWLPHQNFSKLLASRVDVGLQASLTESFNYVSVDHLALGIPVVGSPTLRHLPLSWQADPDDAESIANVLVAHCRNWEQRTVEARRCAELLCHRNNAEFVAFIKRVMEK